MLLRRCCLEPIGREDGTPPDETALQALRASFLETFGKPNLLRPPDSCFSTELCVQVLESWREASADPDWAIARWLASEGARKKRWGRLRPPSSAEQLKFQ